MSSDATSPAWPADADALRSALVAEITRRFGAARVEILAPEIDALVGDLALVAGADLPDDGEPGFFLLTG